MHRRCEPHQSTEGRRRPSPRPTNGRDQREEQEESDQAVDFGSMRLKSSPVAEQGDAHSEEPGPGPAPRPDGSAHPEKRSSDRGHDRGGEQVGTEGDVTHREQLDEADRSDPPRLPRGVGDPKVPGGPGQGARVQPIDGWRRTRDEEREESGDDSEIEVGAGQGDSDSDAPTPASPLSSTPREPSPDSRLRRLKAS